jgi:hypothetical protein
MARFGWAYVNCDDTSGSAGSDSSVHDGVTGSIMFLTGANALSGSDKLIYNFDGSVPGAGSTAESSLILTGTLYVSGAISASSYHFENITNIDSSGSTNFGNTADDNHSRTGSLWLSDGSNVYFTASSTSQQTFVKGFGGNYTQVGAATYTASTSDYIIGVALNSNVVITIPSPADFSAGAIMLIKDEVISRAGTNITLTGSPGEVYNFDDATTYVITGTMPAISIYSNGSNWFVF